MFEPLWQILSLQYEVDGSQKFFVHQLVSETESQEVYDKSWFAVKHVVHLNTFGYNLCATTVLNQLREKMVWQK